MFCYARISSYFCQATIIDTLCICALLKDRKKGKKNAGGKRLEQQPTFHGKKNKSKSPDSSDDGDKAQLDVGNQLVKRAMDLEQEKKWQRARDLYVEAVERLSQWKAHRDPLESTVMFFIAMKGDIVSINDVTMYQGVGSSRYFIMNFIFANPPTTTK